ncbi:MAG: hypothetical protein ACKO2S_05780 [Burkholderiaceae bacterium]
MNTQRMHRNRYRALIGVLLVFSLLLSQWVGLSHAIAHSGIAGAQAISASGWEPIEHSKSASHCAAFDAATLGASLHSSGLLVLPAIRGSAAVKLPIPDGVARLTTRHFNSRAPPQSA